MPRSAADVEAVAAQIPAGASTHEVRGLLGDPLVESDLAGGGLTWLYVAADPEHGVHESLSVAFDSAGAFAGLRRKPID
jgi:outer membrane protein assembly factor BamE (lipoprotein component of BamABCDE complex)